MRLKTLKFHNFRKFELAVMRFHPKFTVLIGDNGQGKTTVLDALAIMLGTYFQGSGIKTGNNTGISTSDARFSIYTKGGQAFRDTQGEVFLEAHAFINGEEVEWKRIQGDRGGQAKHFIAIGKAQRLNIAGNRKPLPLLAYYGVGRLWATYKNISTGKPVNQLKAYDHCLDPRSNQQEFEKWFKRLSQAQLQKMEKKPELDAVKNAVIHCIPNSDDFYFDIELDEIILKFTSDIMFPFNSLSDGYRNLVAMAADIAYRAALLNPQLGDRAAQEIEGVVLIDEIDLHLHPKWQRIVVSSLKEAFPRIQFIATTHSPFILQSLKQGEIIDLSQPIPSSYESFDNGEGAVPAPDKEYSDRSIEDIVEEVMDVEIPQRSERFQKMYEAAKEYYALLAQGENANPEEKEALKKKLDELVAPFSDNVAYHAFLEMERKAADIENRRKA